MRQIIALGGGGYEAPYEIALNRYIVEQCSAPTPNACLLGQAGGEHPEWTSVFHESFGALGCKTSDLSLFFPHTNDIEDFLRSQDLIFVGGGNTRSMLALWREWNIDSVLRQAWQGGTVLAGVSAGAICWFEQGSTDSVPGKLGPLECLGLLPGSCCPHYSEEPKRRPSYHSLVHSGAVVSGYAIDDYAALHFRDLSAYQVASAIDKATAYEVECVDGEVIETPIDVPIRRLAAD